MEIKLKPQEAYYLNRPVLSDLVEILKYAILGLDAEGRIDIFYKKIYINRNARFKRSRMFIRFGPNHSTMNQYTSAETFIISKLNQPDFRLYELRNAIAKGLDKDINKFKRDYVYRDVSSKGFTLFRCFLSSEGRSEIRSCKRMLKDLNKNIDALLKNKTDLHKKLDELGANIILLKDVTLEKLNRKVINLPTCPSFLLLIKSDLIFRYLCYLFCNLTALTASNA